MAEQIAPIVFRGQGTAVQGVSASQVQAWKLAL